MAQSKVDTIKYQNAILYFINKLGTLRGKKKLAKLMYFADFDAYEKFEKSITNEHYFARPMGPLGINLADIINDLVVSKKVQSKEIQDAPHLNPTHEYKAKGKPDLSVFNKDELEIIDSVFTKYGNLNGTELEVISHSQAPYVGTEADKEIAYELALYRGTFPTVSD